MWSRYRWGTVPQSLGFAAVWCADPRDVERCLSGRLPWLAMAVDPTNACLCSASRNRLVGSSRQRSPVAGPSTGRLGMDQGVGRNQVGIDPPDHGRSGYRGDRIGITAHRGCRQMGPCREYESGEDAQRRPWRNRPTFCASGKPLALQTGKSDALDEVLLAKEVEDDDREHDDQAHSH